MRVAMIGLRAPRPGLGGIESALAALCPRLSARGVDVVTYCRSHYAGPEGAPKDITEIPLPTLQTKHLETITYAALAVAAAGDADLIHLHAHGPALLSPAVKLRGKPLVVTLHALDYLRPKWGAFARASLRAGEAFALKYADGLTVVSQEMQRRFTGRTRADLIYTPNGVDPVPTPDPTDLAAYGLRPGEYVLFLGRIVEDKGCHHLLEAFLASNIPGKLALVGPIADEAYAAALRRRAEGNDRVIIPGAVIGPVKEQLLAHAGLFVLPSRVEGLSLALLEAMAAGLPIIASDIPPNSDVATGCVELVPWADVATLARQLAALAANPRRRQELSEAASHRARTQYSWDVSADRLHDLYQRVLC